MFITNGNLTTGHIAVANGRFSGIRQVALVCTLPNTCFLGPSRVQIPNGVSIGSAVLHSSRHTQSVSILYNWPPFPLKIATSHGDLDPI